MLGETGFRGEDCEGVQILLIFKVLCEKSVAYFFKEGMFDAGLSLRLSSFEFVYDFLPELQLYAIN